MRLTESSVNIERGDVPEVICKTKIYLDPDDPQDASVMYWHECAKLPFMMPRGKVMKLKHNGNWYEYEQIYCSFDIETTNIDVKDKHLAFMYHWQFIIAADHTEYNYVIMGRGWSEFIDFMMALRERYDLSADRRIIIWIANLGFEFQFMRKYFDWAEEDFFAREERHPMKCRSGGFEFHEALTISGGSLAQLAKDYTVTQKLAGDLDYDVMRNSHTPLTNQERDYCINDVVILAEWSKFIWETYIRKDKRIPLTKTGILRSETRISLNDTLGPGGVQTYRSLIYEAFPSPETYFKWFKYLFRGGYVHANILMTGFVIKSKKKDKHQGVDGFDITSSYPYEMLTKPNYPLTPFVKEEFSYAALETKCCIMTVRFKNIRRRWSHSIESSSKAIEISGSKKYPIIYDNGRIAQAASLTVMLTELDFATYKKFYIWDGEPEFLQFETAERGYLPRFIRRVLAKYYKLKAQLKREGKQDTPEYVIAKQKVNSFFGMMVTRIELDKISYDNQKDKWIVDEKALDFDEEIKSQFLLPQWGIYCTALARKSLLDMTAALTELIGDGSGDNGAGVIYNDTDSIKIYDPDGLAASVIDEYNDHTVDMRMKAKLLSDDFKGLGQFDHEATYDRFKTLGAKRYLTEEHGKVKATIAGLPKQSILNVDGDPFDKFDIDGMLLDADISLKKTISYNDDASMAMVDGECMYEESSAGIFDINFTMNLNKVFYSLVTSGLTERIRKYGD